MYGFDEKEVKERKRKDAESDLSQVNAMLELVKNNTLACSVECCGLSIGLCNNEKVIPALLHHKGEIEKFLKGMSNEWE